MRSQFVSDYPLFSGIDTHLVPCLGEAERQIACNILNTAPSRQF